jgi:hypothetical protein
LRGYVFGLTRSAPVIPRFSASDALIFATINFINRFSIVFVPSSRYCEFASEGVTVVNRKGIRTVVVIAMIGVVALFFFHSSFGSFTATHGPVTAMRAAQQALRIRTSMIALCSMALVIVAAVRCWFFVQVAKQDILTLESSLGPPIRI